MALLCFTRIKPLHEGRKEFHKGRKGKAGLSFGVEAEGHVYDFVLIFGGFADGDFP
jgi:hypothetical protein